MLNFYLAHTEYWIITSLFDYVTLSRYLYLQKRSYTAWAKLALMQTAK